MECRLSLIRDDFDTREHDGYWPHVAAPLVFVVVLLGMAFCHIPLLLAVLPAFVAGFLVRRWSRRRLSDWARPQDTRGWLVLTPHSIRLEREPAVSCELNGTWSVHVASNHIQGEGMHYRDVLRNGLGVLTANGPAERIEAKFLITTKEQQAALQEVMRSWYRAGLQVTESLGEQRSGILLLRGHRSYADLQRAKADLLPLRGSHR